MRWIGPALYAEGGRDYYFLPAVLRRATEEAACRLANTRSDVADVQLVDAPAAFWHVSREQRILEAVRACSCNLLFVHADGAGDPARARSEQVEPAFIRITRELTSNAPALVAVVPVRETEAWALADGDALRRAFGTSLSDERLGVSARPLDVEREADPKRVLEAACAASVSARGRRRLGKFLDIMGEYVRMDVLRQIPAFVRFEEELGEAVQALLGRT